METQKSRKETGTNTRNEGNRKVRKEKRYDRKGVAEVQNNIDGTGKRNQKTTT